MGEKVATQKKERESLGNACMLCQATSRFFSKSLIAGRIVIFQLQKFIHGEADESSLSKSNCRKIGLPDFDTMAMVLSWITISFGLYS